MGPEALEEFRQGLADGADVDREFETLPETADAARIEDLARRMAAAVDDADRERPHLRDPLANSPVGEVEARRVLGLAYAELFSAAQLRTLQRVEEIRRGGPDAADG